MTSTRGYSETELNLLTLRQGGLEPVDRQGRLRVELGSGPESDLVRATYPLQQTRTPRESRVLTKREFLRLYKGVAVANLEGLLLNSFVTISWSLAELKAPSSVRTAQAAFQERLTSWFHYRRGLDREYPPYAGVWVKEVGRTMGLHTHYLLHVPAGDSGEFRAWVRQTVPKATDRGLNDSGAERGRPRRVAHVEDLGFSIEAQWNVFRYMTKGLDPESLTAVFSASRRRMLAGEYTGLSKLSDEGVVAGQRCGRSKAISGAAFTPWRPTYEAIMDAQWRSAGRKSFHYGPAYRDQGELSRQLESLGV